MKIGMTLISLTLGAAAWGQKPAERKPAQICKLDIVNLTIKSQTEVEEYDAASDKLIFVYNQLRTNFGEELPEKVLVTFSYNASGCSESLQANLTVWPAVASRLKEVSDDPAAANAEKRKVAKFTAVPWVDLNAKIEQVKNGSEVTMTDILIRENFESLGNDKFAYSVRFDLKVIEKDKVVGQKSVVLTQDLK